MTSYPITPATGMAVTLAAAKTALRMDADVTELDAEVTASVLGITQDVEGIIKQQVMPQTWRVEADSFDAAGLPLPHPAQTIVSVTYTDEAGAQQTLPSGQYKIARGRYDSTLVSTAGYTFPTATAVVIDVNCGMAATAADVPAAIALYIIQQLRQQFDPAARLERDTVQSNFVADLLNQFKVQP